MSAKEIVSGLLSELPDDVSLREVAQRVNALASDRGEPPVDTAPESAPPEEPELPPPAPVQFSPPPLPTPPVKPPSLFEARDILRWRHLAAGAIRLLGLCLLLGSIFPFFSWFFEGLIDQDLLDLNYYWPRATQAFGLAGNGLLLLLAAGPLTRWLFPFPGALPPQLPSAVRPSA